MLTDTKLDLVGSCLKDMGFLATHSGYKMLCPAIVWYMQDNKLSAGKGLYPLLSRDFNNVSVKSVERAIHYAIGEAWKHGSRKKWDQYFPGYTEAPSNMRFIAVMAEALR